MYNYVVDVRLNQNGAKTFIWQHRIACTIPVTKEKIVPANNIIYDKRDASVQRAAPGTDEQIQTNARNERKSPKLFILKISESCSFCTVETTLAPPRPLLNKCSGPHRSDHIIP